MAIAADVIVDVGADVAADVAADIAADTVTDVAGDLVTDAVVDAAEDVAEDVASDVADTAEDAAVDTLEDSVDEAGDPTTPEEAEQNETLEEEQAKSEEASKTTFTPDQKFTLKMAVLTTLILTPVSAGLTAFITSLSKSDPDKAKKAVDAATGSGKGVKPADTGLSKEQWKEVNKALGDWDNLSTKKKWERIYKLQVSESLNGLQQYQLMEFMETQFALIEKKLKKKQVWTFQEKYSLYQMLLDATPDAEMYTVMKEAESKGVPILFSVGASLVKLTLSTKYYKDEKWTS